VRFHLISPQNCNITLKLSILDCNRKTDGTEVPALKWTDLLYSLYPHKGTWKEAKSIRRGYELNNPLTARVGMIHAGKLPPVYSFVRIELENVVLSSLKKEMGYDRRSLVLRLYETYGKKTEMKIAFPGLLRQLRRILWKDPSKNWKRALIRSA